MAMTLEFEITVNAPKEKFFALATDVDRFGEWMQGFVRVEHLTDGPMAMGTRFREVRKMFGREAAEEFEVTRWSPPNSFELYVDGTKGASKKGEFHFLHTFEAAPGGGTTMRINGEITGMGCVGVLFGWMMKSMFRKMMKKDHAALKAWVEGQTA